MGEISDSTYLKINKELLRRSEELETQLTEHLDWLEENISKLYRKKEWKEWSEREKGLHRLLKKELDFWYSCRPISFETFVKVRPHLPIKEERLLNKLVFGEIL
jgi:hypothetical protein